MTRTEADLATTIAAAAHVVVDTDTFVAAVKHRARRRRRRHLTAAGVGATAVALSVAVPVSLVAANRTATGPAGASPIATIPSPRVFTGHCTVQPIAAPLDVEPGHPIWLYGMDPTGRYIIGSYGPPAKPDGSVTSAGGEPVRWDNGIGRIITMGGGNNSHATAVNRHGTTVGGLRTVVGNRALSFAWVSLDGTQRLILPTPAGWDDAYAAGINDRGDIVGTVSRASDSEAAPVVWSSTASGGWVSRVIAVPTELRGYGVAITDDGLVVGTLGGEPYVWSPDGTGRALPLPEGRIGGFVEDTRGDWAVGFTPDYVAQDAHLVRWNVRTGEMSVIDVVAPPTTRAAVNSRGDVVWRRAQGTPLLRTHDGREYELPMPRDDRFPFATGEPVAISDDATLIAGFGDVFWRC